MMFSGKDIHSLMSDLIGMWIFKDFQFEPNYA
jgi:hypothetical protein